MERWNEYNQQIDDLEGCLEAEGVRFYAKGTYNCTNCGVGYWLYYSEFFGRIICQNIYEDPITEKMISYDIFNTIKDRVKTINGICEKNYMFTPNFVIDAMMKKLACLDVMVLVLFL